MAAIDLYVENNKVADLPSDTPLAPGHNRLYTSDTAWYCDAVGAAGARFMQREQVQVPARFKWHDLWHAMFAAAAATPKPALIPAPSLAEIEAARTLRKFGYEWSGSRWENVTPMAPPVERLKALLPEAIASLKTRGQDVSLVADLEKMYVSLLTAGLPQPPKHISFNCAGDIRKSDLERLAPRAAAPTDGEILSAAAKDFDTTMLSDSVTFKQLRAGVLKFARAILELNK